LPADLVRWRAERDAVREEVLRLGYDDRLKSFVQSYGSQTLDAANLLLPSVGFIEAGDSRMRSTIDAVRRSLVSNGLVYRYRDDDGLSGKEAAFGACAFWLVDNLTALGLVDEATALFESMIARATPLGLFAEELDPRPASTSAIFRRRSRISAL